MREVDLGKIINQDFIEQSSVPVFKAGDNVSVHYKIKEGDKERIQIFKGDVLKRAGHGASQTFTVRKISNGVGVERVFPLFSPLVATIEVHKVGKVRQSRIYYLRGLRGKAARIKEKISAH